MQRSIKPISLLVAAAFASTAVASHAGDKEKREINDLKAQVKALQAQIDALKDATQSLLAKQPVNTALPAPAVAPAPAPAVASDEPTLEQRVNKMELQVEQLASADAEGPNAGLSITGYADVAYFANRNAKTSSFSFGRPNNSTYAYDNSSMGDIYLDIKKTFGTGTVMPAQAASVLAPTFEVVIAPNRGYGAGSTGGNNIVHTAQVTLPVDKSMSYFFGQIGSFAGYEYYQSNLLNTITHNLLYDFADPAYFTGAGVTYTSGNAAWKFMLGNPNSQPFSGGVKSPTFEYRLDYTWDSKTNIGWSGYVGKSSVNNRQDAPTDFKSAVVYTEADLAYTLFETTLNAQIDYGRQRKAAWNGGDATWWGLSLLGNYKFNDDWAGTLRYDYLDNSKNGGGMPAYYGAGGTDTVNGWGIDPACLADAQANDPSDYGFACKGAKRSAISAALLFYPMKQVVLKSELRFDHANLPVFAKKNGEQVKNNTLFGLQAVYSF